MMSHELLTPLNHVLGFSAMLEIKLLQQRPRPERWNICLYQGQRARTLCGMVHRVLEIARLTSGDLRRDQQDLRYHTHSDGGDRPAPEKGGRRAIITVSFQAAPQPVFAKTSEYEFRLALNELFDNAVKFNRENGQIGVGRWLHRCEVTIRIADAGIGMARGHRRKGPGHVFPREDDFHRRFEGIGLGLTLVALFAQSNGGRLAIESQNGDRGTAIMLSLNRDQAGRWHGVREGRGDRLAASGPRHHTQPTAISSVPIIRSGVTVSLSRNTPNSITTMKLTPTKG